MMRPANERPGRGRGQLDIDGSRDTGRAIVAEACSPQCASLGGAGLAELGEYREADSSTCVPANSIKSSLIVARAFKLDAPSSAAWLGHSVT